MSFEISELMVQLPVATCTQGSKTSAPQEKPEIECRDSKTSAPKETPICIPPSKTSAPRPQPKEVPICEPGSKTSMHYDDAVTADDLDAVLAQMREQLATVGAEE